MNDQSKDKDAIIERQGLMIAELHGRIESIRSERVEMTYTLKPPFEIYHDGLQIADAEGHVCTAESIEVAKAILKALEAAQRLRPGLVVPSTNRETGHAEKA